MAFRTWIPSLLLLLAGALPGTVQAQASTPPPAQQAQAKQQAPASTATASPAAKPKPPAPPLARVAVASSFAGVARTLAADYRKQSGHRIDITVASTGKLYARIRDGAPFDLLLAADADTPRQLADEGLADPDTLHDYAIGRLVLWSSNPAQVADGETLLRKGTITQLAIADPRLSSYGAAARETLDYVRRWAVLQPALVVEEDSGKAAQRVASGDVPLGLLPRALAQEADRKRQGSGWDVPANWYGGPIVHSAVLLEHGHGNAAARGFLKYLQSPAARKKIEAAGYDTAP